MANSNTKTTKRDYFVALRAMVEGIESVGDFSADEVLAFIDTQVAQLDAKAEKAKLRAADKKAEGDELRAAVQSVLTNEFQTREEIFSRIEGEDLTVAKIGARLTQLVAAGIAKKESIKVGDSKKMGYALVSADTDADAE